MPTLSNRDELVAEIAEVFEKSPRDVTRRVTDQNGREVARAYAEFDRLIERGADVFARVHELRQNPAWSPDRPLKAEVKLADINRRVDQAERVVLDLLRYPWPRHLVEDRHPLEPRSLAYFIPIIERQADRAEARARAARRA